MITINLHMLQLFGLLLMSIGTIVCAWVLIKDYMTSHEIDIVTSVFACCLIALIWTVALSLPCTGFQMIQWDLTPLKCGIGV